MLFLKRILQLFLGLVTLLILAIYLNIIWLLAPFYDVNQYVELNEPIMDMVAYEEIWETHRRPYIFSVEASNGAGVWVMGIDHTKNPNDAQLDSIRNYWNDVQPTFALAEGRIGNLIRYVQDPVEECGEGGLLRQLADDNEVPIYSWEPRRDTEIVMLMRDFPVKQLAMFYTFRPYFSNMRFGKPSDPEAALQDYLESRTDYDYLRGTFESWTELDSMWQADYPGLSWRDYSDGSGWPRGYLHDIWNRSNVARDEHMVQIILEQVKAGEKVMVTMGSSHAPRIEKTLRAMLQKYGKEKTPIRLATYTYADNNRLENLRPLAGVLEERMKQPVRTKSYPDVASFLAAIKDNKVDIALINTLGYLLLSLDNEYMDPVMALKVRQDARDNYKTVLLTNNPEVVNLADLKKKSADLSLLLVAEGSTSGNLVPRLVLSSLGIKSPQDQFREVEYGGNHSSTLEKLLNGDVDVCAIGSNEYFKQVEADSTIKDAARLLWISEEIPLGPVLLNKNLVPELQSRITDAFARLHQAQPEAMAALKAGWSEAKQADRFYPVSDKDYDNFRNVNGNITDLAEILSLFSR